MMRILCLWRLSGVFGVAILLGLLTTSCLRIERINQPANARVYTVVTTTLAAFPNAAPGTGHPYLGVHLPNSWSVIPPISYTGSYTGSIIYDGNLSAQMEDSSPESGYYWWVGIGDEHEVLTPDQTATATLRFNPNNQAGFYELDYMTGDSIEGLNFDVHENLPITVTASYGAGWKPIPIQKRPAPTVTTLAFTATLVNLGETGPDSFTLSSNSPPNWAVNFYTSAPLTNTGPMTLYQSLPLTVQLTIPTGSALGTYSIPVTATSSVSPTAVGSILITLVLLSDQRGYALTGDNQVWSIDPLTHQIIDPLSYFLYAESLATHPQGHYLYATYPDNVSVFPENAVPIFDVMTGNLVTFRTVGNKPGLIAFTCGGSKALITDRTSNSLYFLNTFFPNLPTFLGSLENLPGIVRHLAVGGCGTNLALMTSKNSDTATMINTNTMTVIKVISGFQTPGDVVIASNNQRAYVANEDGTIGVIDLPTQSLLQTWTMISTSATQLGLSPRGDALYAGVSSQLLVIDIANGNVINQINLPGNYPDIQDIEISPDGRTIFVAHKSSSTSSTKSVISAIDANSYQIIEIIGFKEGYFRKLILYPQFFFPERTFLPIMYKK